MAISAQTAHVDIGHGLTADIESAERWRALAADERERRLESFRRAFAGVYASTDEFIAEKRREAAHDA